MPRYFFDLTNGGGLVRDEEGVELATLALAREFAAQSIRDVAAADICDGRPLRMSHSIGIRDADGEPVETLTFGNVIEVVP